jgi:hypothetical protein
MTDQNRHEETERFLHEKNPALASNGRAGGSHSGHVEWGSGSIEKRLPLPNPATGIRLDAIERKTLNTIEAGGTETKPGSRP